MPDTDEHEKAHEQYRRQQILDKTKRDVKSYLFVLAITLLAVVACILFILR